VESGHTFQPRSRDSIETFVLLVDYSDEKGAREVW